MGDGLRVRLKPVPGVTPVDVLAREFYFNAVLGDIDVEAVAEHVDYGTVGAGEFSVPAPGGRDAVQLKRVTLEVIASDAGEPWLVDADETINSTRTVLDRVLEAKRAVDLLGVLSAGADSGVRPEFHFRATLRRVSRTLRHAQLGYRYFEVEFTQWRDTRVGRPDRDDEGKSDLPKKVKLTAADTGRSLSKRHYGNYGGALTILFANGLRRWGPETPIVQSKKFKAGDRFVIPKLPVATIRVGR